MDKLPVERRRFIKSTAFGLFGISGFGFASAKNIYDKTIYNSNGEPLFYRYPAVEDKTVSEIVGASHRDLNKVKELVSRRPELASMGWDWGFGDFGTALGAASHVGRRDIAELLMSHGARPDIFTFAMMGMLKSLQEIIETIPGIQGHTGPHGITLLAHARNRLTDKMITSTDSANVQKVISYLEGLGNADVKNKSLLITEEEKQKYIGEYRFGDGAGELFVVDLTASTKNLKLGRKGSFGSFLHKTGEHTFSPSGAPSVKIVFTIQDARAVSLTIHEPEPLVTAVRI
ncbi:MAG: hypothetical protein IPI54_08645 [Chitinophagaceae bacterium]|nr:hypothetical protein [Chitinophagaceae bacterium]